MIVGSAHQEGRLTHCTSPSLPSLLDLGRGGGRGALQLIELEHGIPRCRGLLAGASLSDTQESRQRPVIRGLVFAQSSTAHHWLVLRFASTQLIHCSPDSTYLLCFRPILPSCGERHGKAVRPHCSSPLQLITHISHHDVVQHQGAPAPPPLAKAHITSCAHRYYRMLCRAWHGIF